jgi:hypothetical protein
MNVFGPATPGIFAASILALQLVTGCATPPPDRPAAVPVLSEHAIEKSLPANFRMVRDMDSDLEHLEAGFAELHKNGDWQSQGYFSPSETDRMEFLLFRSVAAQTALWDLVDSYGGMDGKFSADDVETRAHVLSIAAALQLAGHAAFVVLEFADDPVAIGQINQPHFRSELPAATYDRMRDNATAPDVVDNAEKAGEFLRQQMADPDSALMKLSARDPDYRNLISRMPSLQAQTEQRLRDLAQIAPSHARAELTTREDIAKEHRDLYKIRSILFKDISRLKSPTAHLVRFSDAQKKQIFELLQPGDLILTYTAGYASDVFIPGAFKHGITFVGTPEQRAPLRLSPDLLPSAAQYEAGTLGANLQSSSLPNGKAANMIEAVAEGVIFNDLEHIMDTHVNRLLVLRPQLTESERARFLVGIFSYLGDSYDFRFDFSDASRQVCTEVIYRALDGKGAVQYSLTERGGHPTLSADDIANDYLVTTPHAYDFVLYVEEDPASDAHDAIILTGREGRQRLATLMAEQAK